MKLFEAEPRDFPFMMFPTKFDFDYLQTQINKTHKQEVVMAYSVFRKGLSFSAMTEISNTIRLTCLNANFQCAADKMAALCRNVFAPFAFNKMKSELEKAKWFCIHFDTATLFNTKILVVLAKYYDPTATKVDDRIQIRCICIRSIITETAEDIFEHIKDSFMTLDLDPNKIVALSADNTNSSFGGKHLNGKKNVREMIEKKWLHGRTCIRIGCVCHICQNSIKATTKSIKADFDIVGVVSKTYAQFNQQVKSRHELKLIWIETGNSDKMPSPQNYCETRWLSLRPAIKTIIQLWDVLGNFFDCRLKEVQKSRDKSKIENIKSLHEFYRGDGSHLNLILLKSFSSFTLVFSDKLRMLQPNDSTVMTGLMVVLFLCVSPCTNNQFDLFSSGAPRG